MRYCSLPCVREWVVFASSSSYVQENILSRLSTILFTMRGNIVVRGRRGVI